MWLPSSLFHASTSLPHLHPPTLQPFNPSTLSLPQVRKAFMADTSEDRTLIVADYGQLELRILAHMANCKVGVGVGV